MKLQKDFFVTTQTHNSERCHNLPQHVRFRTILGRADDLRADVYFQIRVPITKETEPPFELEGILNGPLSTRASTLPVRQNIRMYSQQVVDGGVELLGHSILTEPAFWTPNVPMLYSVKCKITSSGQDVDLLSETIGLRRLGIRNHSLWLDSHRFVVRGVTCSNRGNQSPEQRSATTKDYKTAEVIDLSTGVSSETNFLGPQLDENLKSADESGRPIIVRLNPQSSPCSIPAIICQLTNHPAVLITVIPDALLPEVPKFLGFKGTMLFATEVPAEIGPPELPSGVDLAIVRLSKTVPVSSWKNPPPYPTIAWQTGVPSQRKECDRLQALLASWRTTSKSPPSSWDWAGFFVGDETIHHQT